MIVESEIKSLKEEQVKLKDETVESSNPYLPKLYFCAMFIGSKGSGKTYSLVSLLKHYEKSSILDKKGRKHVMRTIVFAPTATSDFNKIYTTLESLDQEKDIILEYSDEKLLEVLDQIKGEEEEIKEYYKYQKAYNKFKSNEKLKDKHLLILDKYDFKDPFITFDMVKPKYTQYRVNFLIFDDLISHQSAFKRNSKICNLTIKCRHHHCSLLFTTQYAKGIPPVIRTNTDLWILFKFASKERIIEQIYNEVSSILTIEQFEALYEYATKDSKHDCLIIDNHSRVNKDLMFRRNWNIVLKIT